MKYTVENQVGTDHTPSTAIDIVSHIENDDIARIVPSAPPDDAGPYAPKGDNGGYFIGRNSWGRCWGDGGYVYIPYRWLRPVSFVQGATALDPASIQDAP